MGTVGQGYSGGWLILILRLVIMILGGVYLEIHWKLGLLRKSSRMGG